jgi:hypothetical protein
MFNKFNKIFGRTSLKKAWGIIVPYDIVKKEADWGYRSGVFAQELYSLFLNKTLKLYLNTIENIEVEFSRLYIVYYA